jgi:HAD superfamily hydrolase (TIGR01484 family)
MKEINSLPKLAASDIGGTLSCSSDSIPPFTASVLNRLAAAGVPVVLITGYNYNTALRFLKSLDERIMLMPQNGSLCIKQGKLVWEYRIPEVAAKKLCDFLGKQNLPIIIYKGKNEDFGNYYIYREKLPWSNNFQKIDSLRDFENITGISTFLPDEIAGDVREKIRYIIGDKFKVIYTKQVKGSWLEAVHAEVRKDLSLKRLCEEMNIPLQDVIYFGDNFNDQEVLRAVGRPVLVENAAPELKEEFAAIIKPVNEEGVAHYLNELYNLGL